MNIRDKLNKESKIDKATGTKILNEDSNKKVLSIDMPVINQNLRKKINKTIGKII